MSWRTNTLSEKLCVAETVPGSNVRFGANKTRFKSQQLCCGPCQGSIVFGLICSLCFCDSFYVILLFQVP